MKIQIEGLVVTTSPMVVATALKDNLRFDHTTGTVSSGTTGMPLTATVQKGILVQGQSRPDYVPYFPANDLRGRLRRHACNEILDVLKTNGEHVNIDTFDGMNAGNFRGRPDNTPTTLEETLESDQHFFMGAFGGGPRTLRSKLITHDLNPIYSATLTAAIVPDRFAGYGFTGVARDMIDYFSCIRRDDTTNFSSLTMLDHIKDGLNAINDRQDELTVARNSRKAEKAAIREENEATDSKKGPVKKPTIKKDDLANMFAYQCARAGLPMFLKVGFSSDPTKAQVGLILEALLVEFNKNALGGLIRLGTGNFNGFAEVVVDGRNLGPVLQRAQTASENVTPGFELTEVADEFIAAKDDALMETSAADLERFFVYGEPATRLASAKEEAA